MRQVKLFFVTVLMCALLATVSFAAETNTDTLSDWGIRLTIPAGMSSVLNESDGGYYIYPDQEGSIPYVMVYRYEGFDDERDVIEHFLMNMMRDYYSDLDVLVEPTKTDLFGDEYFEIVFTYTVDGYQVLDHRYLRDVDDTVYMFTSKEIEELDMSVGDLLEDVIASCEFLNEDVEGPSDDTGVEKIVWEDYIAECDPDEIRGQFVPFDSIGLELFVPEGYESIEIDEEILGPFYLGYFTTDTTNLNPAIAVQYIEGAAIRDFDEYCETIEGLGDLVEVLGKCEINGIPCYLYRIPMAGSMTVGTVLDGGILEVSFLDQENPEYTGVYEAVAASIRPMAEEENLIDDGINDEFISFGESGITDSKDDIASSPLAEVGRDIIRNVTELVNGSDNISE